MESINWTSLPPGAQCLTIITARGGSKGLPGKNIRDLAGKPLIAWTIEAARGARLAQHIIVSTDDTGIASVAMRHGAGVPFLRPAELATDTASSEAVALHAIDFFAQKGIHFPHVLLLQPTSPLRTACDIDDAFALMMRSGASSCVSVCENEHSAYNVFFLNKNKTLSYVLPPRESSRRQDHPKTYRTNGAIYFVETEVFLRRKTFIDGETMAFVMPMERSVDIDSSLDFTVADALMHALSG